MQPADAGARGTGARPAVGHVHGGRRGNRQADDAGDQRAKPPRGLGRAGTAAMTKLIDLLMCAALTGCMINKPLPSTVGTRPATDVGAEAKLAEKLPLVTPESITADNAAAKGRELQAELDRAAKNLAAARAT